MSKQNWIADAIEQNRRDTADIPRWVLNSYLPKPEATTQSQTLQPAQSTQPKNNA